MRTGQIDKYILCSRSVCIDTLKKYLPEHVLTGYKNTRTSSVSQEVVLASFFLITYCSIFGAGVRDLHINVVQFSYDCLSGCDTFEEGALAFVKERKSRKQTNKRMVYDVGNSLASWLGNVKTMEDPSSYVGSECWHIYGGGLQ